MAKSISRASLMLATVNGKLMDDSRSFLSLPLHGHLVESKLPVTDGFDLPSSALRNLSIPHGHGLSCDAESISKRLMGSAEMPKNVGELNHANKKLPDDLQSSVSVLPDSVKRLTRSKVIGTCKMPYMRRSKERDPWAVERGLKMRQARIALEMSQGELATRCGIKDRETISQYEGGIIKDIDRSLIPSLSRELGLPVHELTREEIVIKDDGKDLRISSEARSVAYKYDTLPLFVRNQIQDAIRSYGTSLRRYGKKDTELFFEIVQKYGDLAKSGVMPSEADEMEIEREARRKHKR